MNMLKSMKRELAGKINQLIITCVVDDFKIQGPDRQREMASRWLQTRGRQWGYILNTQPGKTLVIKGKWPVVAGMSARAITNERLEKKEAKQEIPKIEHEIRARKLLSLLDKTDMNIFPIPATFHCVPFHW